MVKQILIVQCNVYKNKAKCSGLNVDAHGQANTHTLTHFYLFTVRMHFGMF
jgi:hypothetical protein